jgi:hypothetical protein
MRGDGNLVGGGGSGPAEMSPKRTFIAPDAARLAPCALESVDRAGRHVIGGEARQMDVQRTGRIFGWLFIGTFVTSIPARLLFIDGLGDVGSRRWLVADPLPRADPV